MLTLKGPFSNYGSHMAGSGLKNVKSLQTEGWTDRHMDAKIKVSGKAHLNFKLRRVKNVSVRNPPLR